MIRRLLILLSLIFATGAHANCRQALALALDVSGSVDAREYRLQIQGVARSLADREVRDKLLAMPSAPVRLMVFEWSGPSDQRVLLPWTSIDSAATLESAIETLARTKRREATPGTALGTAMSLGVTYLDQQRNCWKRTLDISGDGKSNLGPRPRDIKSRLEGRGIIINGLVIGVDDPNIGDVRQSEIGELSSYFKAHVIIGPDAFVLTAIGYADYARAMREKLLRELDGLVFSKLDLPENAP